MMKCCNDVMMQNERIMNMKKILNIMVLSTLMACLVPANAQDFNQKRIETPIQSQQIMTTGASYSGTVYEPFSNATPADYNSVGATAPTHSTSGPRRGFINPSDPGDKSNEFPLGDAVLPLLAFALMFCGYVAIRRKRVVNG